MRRRIEWSSASKGSRNFFTPCATDRPPPRRGVCSVSTRCPLMGPRDPEPRHVERRKEDQCQKRRDRQAAHDRVGHRTPEDGRRDRDHAEDRSSGGQQDRAEAVGGRLDDRIPRIAPVRLLLFDLVDQDHRVARDHAGQREHAEECDEAEGLVREQERRDDPDEAERGHAEHQEQAIEALELDHQHGQDQDEHQRQDRCDGRLRLAALLDRSADCDVVTARQARIQGLDLRRQSLDDGRGLNAGRDIGLHRHGGPPVAAPDDGIFLAVIDGGDLAQRNGLPVRQRHLKRADRRERHALLGGGPDEHIDEIDAAAHLGRT